MTYLSDGDCQQPLSFFTTTLSSQHGSALEGVGGAGTVLLSRATMFNVTSVLIITVEVCD